MATPPLAVPHLAAESYRAADALLSLLFPFWQFVIGVCALGVLVLSARQLMARGPTRMKRAMTVIAVAIGCLMTLVIILDNWSSS